MQQRDRQTDGRRTDRWTDTGPQQRMQLRITSRGKKCSIAALLCCVAYIVNCSAVILGHADVLRVLHNEISTAIDAHGVARNMFQCNALTLKELQSIQSKRSESVKAAEQLLDIVIKQSANVFSCFLDALKMTGHRHVFETIVSGSYRGTHGNVLSVTSIAFY